MAGKGMTVGRTRGNGIGATHAASSITSSGIASEFDRSMNKARYVDETPVPVIVTDCEHNIEYLNPAAALMAGSAPGTCIGQKMWALFEMEACHNGSCVASQAMREGHAKVGEAECMVKGRNLLIRTHATPRYDENNKLIGVIQVILDESVKRGDLAILIEFGKGNYDAEPIEIDGNKAVINPNIERLRSNVKSFIEEIKHMSEAHEAGDIDVVILEEKFEGSYRAMAKGVNDMVLGSIDVRKRALACITQFGEGNFDASLEQFPRKAAVINDIIEEVRKNLKALVADTNILVQAAVEGKLDTRADASKHQGHFRKIVQGVNNTLDAVIGPLTFSAGYVDRISKGDIPEKITANYNGDFNLIKNNLNQCIDAVNALVADATMLTRAAVDGKLETRADASKHQGDYRKIVQGVNDTLDAVIGPLTFSAGYVDRISKGDIPEKITANYNGDFNLIKLNLNQCIEAVSAMAADAAMLTRAAVDGKLETRADASKHQGDYRKIVQGVNDTLDAVIGPLTFSAGYVDRISKGDIPEKITANYNGDFNLIKLNLNQCIEAVSAMAADAAMLTKAAVEGKLETRADATRHQGDYRKIVQGVNDTLDAVVGPIQDVSAVLAKLAGGDFTALVTGKYAGDYEHLASAVNTLSKSVRSALEQIGNNVAALASSAEELNKVSQSMGANADETATQASVVSAASEQVSTNVQTVATGADEMGTSIKEIAKNTAEATRVALAAVRTAEVTNETIAKLGQSSAEVGQVIKVITSIAQQTNLLALNATIEAARAGEAGKGFAVVANEVKELAKETAKATEDISRKIEAIQGDTNGAVSAISQISQVIGQISGIQTTIASAIEEQSATTNEIGRNLAEIAKGSTDISRNIGGVADAARATTVGATDTSKAAHSLEKMAAELQTLVGQFRY